ncbi:MAG: response regulator transcription factor [Alphaproteobacteria bacterium]|nr:response regulator transcription factor [Alphaproteobacteria bacterium]
MDTIEAPAVRVEPAVRISPMRHSADTVVALVDPSRLRRECLKLALGQHNGGWRVVDLASAADALRLAAGGQHFDLLLIGAATSELVDLGEIEALRRALPDTPLVVAAENDNPQRARMILGAGTRGFLPTSLSLKVLMGALDLVLAGGIYVPSSLIEGNGAPRSNGAAPSLRASNEPWSDLTRRQRDVLNLIAQGKSNKLIADALEMSESTVKAHVKQIIKRLHVANRTQAALIATGASSLVAGASSPFRTGVAARI